MDLACAVLFELRAFQGDLRGERLLGEIYIRISYILYTCRWWELKRLALYACVALIST